MGQYRVTTPTGSVICQVAGFEARFGVLTLLDEADHPVSAYAPGEWLRIEPITDPELRLEQKPRRKQESEPKGRRPERRKWVSNLQHEADEDEGDAEAEALAKVYGLLLQKAQERKARKAALQKKMERDDASEEASAGEKEKREALARVYSIILSDDWGKDEEANEEE